MERNRLDEGNLEKITLKDLESMNKLLSEKVPAYVLLKNKYPQSFKKSDIVIALIDFLGDDTDEKIWILATIVSALVPSSMKSLLEKINHMKDIKETIDAYKKTRKN